MSTIVLNTLSYAGEGVVNGISRFVERSAGVVAYFRSLTASVKTTNSRTAVKWKLVLPFPSSAPASCPCPGEAPFLDAIVNIDVRLDARADEAFRTAVQIAITDLAAKDEFKNSIKLLTTPN